ncbi:hypothetical protein FQN57_002009 [Myotisia sp. PD_48]|nr:hypothetical protein FQN57_002009 [Myotisia sp. PD_48]
MSVMDIYTSSAFLPRFPADHYRPKSQPWHIYDESSQTWNLLRPLGARTSCSSPPPALNGQSSKQVKPVDSAPSHNNRFRLITWNIDCMIPYPTVRMSAGLKHLDEMVHSPPEPFEKDIPIIIMLQEMVASDLEQIREAPWVRKSFIMSNIDTRGFEGLYSTISLIQARKLHDEMPTNSFPESGGCDPSLWSIRDVFRVQWLSKFNRNGLFIDIEFPFNTAALISNNEAGPPDNTTTTSSSSSSSSSPSTTITASPPAANTRKPKKLRLCNTHLESLPSQYPIRPDQVASAMTYLKQEGINGSVLAGDMNAIQPSDRYIAEDNDLTDAYLELGGKEESEEGHTWGYQSDERDMERFPPVRMDKVFYRGDLAIRELTRIGVDIMVEGQDLRDEMQQRGIPPYVTDHYGLMAELEVL